MNKYESATPLPKSRQSEPTGPMGLGFPDGWKCKCNFPTTKEGWRKFADEVWHNAAKREIPKAARLLKEIEEEESNKN